MSRRERRNYSSNPPLASTASGHVAGNRSTQIDQSADWLAFVTQELGMEFRSA
jgi:hypothetical protein